MVGPHASVAVAVPSASLISDAAGLHPRLRVVPPTTPVGGVKSCVHVTVLDIVTVFVHPSVAVKVLVCERLHPLLWTLPSLNVTVGAPHASLADAPPNAAVISLAAGLQPRVVADPLAMIEGGTRSLVHVTVLEAVAVLPQASLAVNVLVCD